MKQLLLFPLILGHFFSSLCFAAAASDEEERVFKTIVDWKAYSVASGASSSVAPKEKIICLLKVKYVGEQLPSWEPMHLVFLELLKDHHHSYREMDVTWLQNKYLTLLPAGRKRSEARELLAYCLERIVSDWRAGKSSFRAERIPVHLGSKGVMTETRWYVERH